MTNTDLSGTTSTTTRQASVPAPGRFDAETEARLDGIDRDATRHVQDNRPAKTRNGYAADWRAWEAFCTETNLPPLAVRSGTLVLFTEWCWIQPGYKPGLFMAPSTIDRRLAGVVVTGRREHKLQLAVDVAEEARALLKAKVKAMEKTGEQRGRGQAPALLVRHMERIVRTLPDDLSGVRDLSLMTMHFAIAGREHEVGWLRERHVAEDPEGRGLIVDVRISKNYPRVVQVPYGSRAHLCPVRAWRRWREASGIAADPDGFAYRRLHSRHHTVMDQGLDAEAVGDVITRLAERADLDIRPTGHSPRRGLVTESSRAGNPDAVAEKQGGWAKGSKVMRRYREDDDGFTENALHGVL
ncbi:integrase [Streptomyces malaysiensis]|uniref:integrase n=1 Tax=Streptomyces malaysiensis TaxID=92644 RepID=UPI000BFCF72A|nr:integrase [Streptomyces malaysiensis]ATL88782.1 integrase family protein [Streptomyces malaysiensis]